MITLSRTGLIFNYYEDQITLRWPWVSGSRYKSSIYSVDFNSFRDYWMTVGAFDWAVSNKGSSGSVTGLRLHEVLGEYVRHKFPGEYVAVLADIDTSKKDSAFWNRIPKHKAEQLLKDLAIFRCNDRAQMLDITLNTSPGFATAYAFENGMLVDSNLWER